MVAEKDLTPAQRRIFVSMVELLARAGLEYRGGFVRAGEHDIHYLDYGEGPPIVLVHGGGAGSAVWYRQIAALSRNHRVIAPDNPVFGLSERVQIREPVPRFVTGFLGSFLDAIGIDSADFAGLSIGGFATLRFALESPDRVGRLALLDSAGLGPHLPWAFRLATMPVFGHVLTLSNRWAHARFFATQEVANAHRPDHDQFIGYAYEVTRDDGHGRAVRLNMPGFAGLRGQRWVLTDAELKSIRSQTLIIWGDQDRFFPLDHAERALRLIPSARLEVVRGAGHVSIWDAPEEISQLLTGFFDHG